MSFIFFLLILAIFIIILIPTILFSVIRTIFSILGFINPARKRRASSSRKESGYTRYEQTGGSSSQASASPRKKMFDKNEGEYVDFEEIKDEK